MARNEDGEYELLVGNKQLLSVVFVLMILFGIFFSLGYFVGRNSAPETARAAQTPTQSGGVAQPKEPPAAAVSEPALGPGEAKVAETGAGAETPPAAEPTPQAPAPAPAEPAPEPVAQSPQPGQVFLQVRAVKRADADILADVLKRKGFPALVAPVVVDGAASDVLFRVLVGPLRDAGDVAKTKSELDAAGFTSIIRKY